MRRVIRTEGAPVPIGPYSQSVAIASQLFTSGQIGVDPATGKLVDGGVESQTRRTLENIKAIVEAAGGHLEDVVKVTIFLVDMQDFKAFNEVYAEYFPTPSPARTTVAVAALPAGARIEIDAVAAWD
jgi:2-iminobutanoate/2-iminopropanoate deaminase